MADEKAKFGAKVDAALGAEADKLAVYLASKMGGPEAAALEKAAVDAKNHGHLKEAKALDDAAFNIAGSKLHLPPEFIAHEQASMNAEKQGHQLDAGVEDVKAIVSLFAAGLNAVEKKLGLLSAAPQQPDPNHPAATPVNLAQANTKGPSKG